MTTIKRTLELAARAATAERVEARLRASGAIRDADDGGIVIDTDVALAEPGAAGELGELLSGTLGGARVDVVVGGPDGSARLAGAMAGCLGVPAVVIGDGANDDERSLTGARVVLVRDVPLDEGGSLRSEIGWVEARGGEVLAVLVLIGGTRRRPVLSSPSSGRTYPLRALWQPDQVTVVRAAPAPAPAPAAPAS